MRFAILMTDLAGTWDGLPPEQQQAILGRHEALERALSEAGKFVEALHFHPVAEARTVRMDGEGGTTVAHGPFTDGSEYVGGIYVIEADSMDEAVDWARRARFMVGANEVRGIHA